MAEMHPILWSRVTDRRLSAKHVKIAVLSTFNHRSTELADIELIFKPQTDLAILNYVCNHITQSGAVNQDFVAKHVSFHRGVTDVGYGLRRAHLGRQKARPAGRVHTHLLDAAAADPACGRELRRSDTD